MKRALPAVLVATFIASPAFATLIGDEVDARWQSPLTGLDIQETYIVDAGIEGDPWLSADFIDVFLDIGESSIDVDFEFDSEVSAAGIVPEVQWTFSDLDWTGTPGSIVDASVDTNYIDWNPSYLSFGSDFVQVTYGDLVEVPVDGSDFFSIDITAEHEPIPEPTSLAILGMGMAGLAARRQFLG